MPFKKDSKFAAEVGNVYGEYLITFISEPRGEVRADIFRRGSRVDARLSFPTGIDASEVKESYVTDLEEYAKEKGFLDRLHLIYS